MGIFILVCSLFCLTIAGERYYSAIKSAEEVAKAMPWFQLEAVTIPIVTIVCGAAGVMLLVASLMLIVKSFKEIESNSLIETES